MAGIRRFPRQGLACFREKFGNHTRRIINLPARNCNGVSGKHEPWESSVAGPPNSTGAFCSVAAGGGKTPGHFIQNRLAKQRDSRGIFMWM